MYISFAIAGRLQLDEKNSFQHVFRTITFYGLPWMNLKLFLWTMLGLFVAFVGCFMASICVTTADQLTQQVRQILVEGMKRYFTDVTWKRRIDNMQVEMRCCGIDSSDDWHSTYWLQRDLLILDSPDILRYAKLDGRVTPPVVPWSCCRIDVKGPCYHDPLQLPNPEQNSTYDSLNAPGCLVAMKTLLNGALYSVLPLLSCLFVLQIIVTVLSRLDFTSARNAVALGNRRADSPGWLYGRLDFGNADGPNLLQIDRKNSGRGDSMIDLKPLVYSSDTE
ncbi:peripherin-2 isoform X2 [Osmia lignaria lignaria]|uniref:peripherin-2 isoform X2 n=1 Tax=Osmia lignaria lignaria TaxID=1437193 RepID=UPI00402BBCC6